MAQRLGHRTLRQHGQARVRLERAQRDHRADAVSRFCLFDPVQPKSAQVDCRPNTPVLHLEPEHTAQHYAAFFLTKRVRFVQALRPDILPDRQQSCSLRMV